MDRRAEPIVGWRVWRVAEAGDGLRLRSAVYDDEWEPGHELAATCARGVAHPAPAGTCDCGIYAARDPAQAVRYLVGRDDPEIVHRVIGFVALTGVVIEGTAGWRAACGYPARLWVPAGGTNGEPAPAERVAAALAGYGVRVAVVGAWEPAVLAAALAHTGAVEGDSGGATVDEPAHLRHERVSHGSRVRR